MSTIFIFILLFLLQQQKSVGANRTANRLAFHAEHMDKRALHSDVLGDNYNPLFPAIKRRRQANDELGSYINPFLRYHLTKIINLDEKAEQLSVATFLEVRWTDGRLQWEPSNYGGLTSLTQLPVKTIWFPKILVQNGIGVVELLHKDDKVIISDEGHVTWEGISVLTTPCDLDITYFPVDVQVCQQQFRYDDYPSLRGVVASEFISQVLEIPLYDDTMWFLNRSEDIQVLHSTTILSRTMTFELTLRRKYRYYMYRILAPVTILAVLVIISFFIPPDAGEKIGFGITLLLTFSVFQTMIDADLPASSNSTPLLTTAMVLLQVCSATSIVASVIVLNLYHLGSEYGGTMPAYLNLLFFTVLAKLTFHTRVAERVKRRRKAASTGDAEAGQIDNTSAGDKKGSGTSDAECCGIEWKVAALIVDRLLMYVCLVTMVAVYVTLVYRLHRQTVSK